MSYGNNLYLYNHDTRKAYDLGKILGGGSVDYKISSGPNLPEDKALGAREQILVTNANQRTEIVVSNTPRWNELVDQSFNYISLEDILYKGEE